MERTESKIVQVAPTHEQDMIKLMEIFCWNLLSRQEMHEEGNTEGYPSLLGDEYIIKTKVNHYVKLHFSRNLRLPNLEKIRVLEQEYFGLDTPSIPLFPVLPLFPWGWIIWIFLVPIWILYYFFYYRPKKPKVEQQRVEVAERSRQILKEVDILSNNQ